MYLKSKFLVFLPILIFLIYILSNKNAPIFPCKTWEHYSGTPHYWRLKIVMDCMSDAGLDKQLISSIGILYFYLGYSATHVSGELQLIVLSQWLWCFSKFCTSDIIVFNYIFIDLNQKLCKKIKSILNMVKILYKEGQTSVDI